MHKIVKEILEVSKAIQKMASKPVDVYDVSVAFENQTGDLALYVKIDVESLGVQALVDYPYVINKPERVYQVLRDHQDLWLKGPSGVAALIIRRFHEFYDKGNNPGGFEISSMSKWVFKVLDYQGIALSGDPQHYEKNFGSGVVDLKVFVEFALRQSKRS